MYARHSFGWGLSNPWRILADPDRFYHLLTLLRVGWGRGFYGWLLLALRYLKGRVSVILIFLQLRQELDETCGTSCSRKSSKICLGVSPKSSKIIKNEALWHIGWVHGHTSGSRTVRVLRAGLFWAPVERFWASFGPQLGAEGLPKSSILASDCIKNENMRSRKAS